MKKNMLLESINKQRKLMGLNEILDANVNVDAKGALSGNKVDLGIVPLEEIDPMDDELQDDPDAQEMADEIDLSDVDDSDDINRHPDEDDFYRSQPGENFSDKMDSMYPDPNERDWQMNRYSGNDESMEESGVPPRMTPNQMKYGMAPGSNKVKPQAPKLTPNQMKYGTPPKVTPNDMMNESELDEIFGINTAIKGAISGGKRALKVREITKQTNVLAKIIQQMQQFVTKSDDQFNKIQGIQQQIATLGANDPAVQPLNTILNNMKATWTAQKKDLSSMTTLVGQMQQVLGGNTQAGGTGNAQQPAFTPGQNVTYTDPKDPKNVKYGVVDNQPAAKDNTMVKYVGSNKAVPVSNQNLKPR